MPPADQNLPDLESRFLPPEGWHWDNFTNSKSRRLRYGFVMPPGGAPDAIVIGLQGLSEFGEKYFETAHDLLKRNLGFFMMDWQGQGLSDRHLDNPHRRHATSFDDDLADFHQFLAGHIRPAAGKAPLVMLSHSMGGNIGLRYLIEHPGTFAAAAFSAPMTGIRALRALAYPLRLALTAFFDRLKSEDYVFGGHDWRPQADTRTEKDRMSADPVRSRVQEIWCLHNPALQVGNVTFGWLYEAVLSCRPLEKPDAFNGIKTPCLFALAGHERLVDNNATRRLAGTLPQARLIELPESYHEILMERDAVRGRFLSAFDSLLADALREKKR